MQTDTPRLRRLLLVAFLESFMTILVERGVYFFAKHRLGFTDTMNLWLALAFGVAYVVGSLLSHPLSKRISEKALLSGAIAAQVVVAAALALRAETVSLFLLQASMAFIFGLKWPVIESYVCARQTPRQVARSLGVFNFCWSSAVPLSLAAAGPLIDWRADALFIAAGACSVASFMLALPLPRRLEHIPHDHPERPSAADIPRYRSLLVASRSQMLASYSLLWILAALMPGVFERLSLPLSAATSLAAVLELARVAAFVALRHYKGWHNRAAPLAAAMIALPAGFFMVLFGPTLAVVLAGEVLFGLAAGMIYYAALYYAMVVMNASVEAGGGHEALIGGGFALGPACALVGMGLLPLLQSRLLGTLAGVGPLFLACCALTARGLIKADRK